MNLRAVACRALVPVINQRSSMDASLANKEDSVDENDRPLLRELCYGTCRYYHALTFWLGDLMAKPLKDKDVDVQSLLLLGLYQLAFMRVPDHAAINETVHAVKALKKPWAGKLVNAVLRNFQRQRAEILKRSRQQLARQSHPQWLAKSIDEAWPDLSREIFTANNSSAPMTLRVNLLRGSREDYLSALQAQGIVARACEYSRSGITLEAPVDVKRLPAFSLGACSVQDEAAQLSATLLDVKSGYRVLDACCAPGGKTCHIAETCIDLSALVAIDCEEERLPRVRENLARLKLKATLVHAEAQKLDSWWDGVFFDRILLDAPCSATGVIRRHPDIKLLRRQEDIAALTNLQQTLMQNLWNTLAPGGVMVYATCSVLPEENEKQVEQFVQIQADAIHLPIDASWGVARPHGRQLFPSAGGHDGFYYARIQKR